MSNLPPKPDFDALPLDRHSPDRRASPQRRGPPPDRHDRQRDYEREHSRAGPSRYEARSPPRSRLSTDSYVPHGRISDPFIHRPKSPNSYHARGRAQDAYAPRPRSPHYRESSDYGRHYEGGGRGRGHPPRADWKSGPPLDRRDDARYYSRDDRRDDRYPEYRRSPDRREHDRRRGRDRERSRDRRWDSGRSRSPARRNASSRRSASPSHARSRLPSPRSPRRNSRGWSPHKESRPRSPSRSPLSRSPPSRSHRSPSPIKRADPARITEHASPRIRSVSVAEEGTVEEPTEPVLQDRPATPQKTPVPEVVVEAVVRDIDIPEATSSPKLEPPPSPPRVALPSTSPSPQSPSVSPSIGPKLELIVSPVSPRPETTSTTPVHDGSVYEKSPLLSAAPSEKGKAREGSVKDADGDVKMEDSPAVSPRHSRRSRSPPTGPRQHAATISHALPPNPTANQQPWQRRRTTAGAPPNILERPARTERTEAEKIAAERAADYARVRDRQKKAMAAYREASLATAKAEHDYQMAALESQMIQQRRERAEAQLAAAVAGKLGIDYVPKHRPVSPGPL